jgi:methylglyoxal reductase
MLHREAEVLPACKKNGLATLTYMSLEQGLLTGKIGMDRVFKPEEFRSNSFWNDWMIPVNRKRVLDLLASWKNLTGKYNCTLSQLVIAWTAAQAGVTPVLAGGRNIDHVRENARAGELNIEAADLARIRKDVEALGQPQKE